MLFGLCLVKCGGILRYGVGVMEKVEEELVFLSAAVMYVWTSLQTSTCSTKSPFLRVTFEDCVMKVTADVLESKTVPLSHV